jgi:hypothetical protein
MSYPVEHAISASDAAFQPVGADSGSFSPLAPSAGISAAPVVSGRRRAPSNVLSTEAESLENGPLLHELGIDLRAITEKLAFCAWPFRAPKSSVAVSTEMTVGIASIVLLSLLLALTGRYRLRFFTGWFIASIAGLHSLLSVMRGASFSATSLPASFDALSSASDSDASLSFPPAPESSRAAAATIAAAESWPGQASDPYCSGSAFGAGLPAICCLAVLGLAVDLASPVGAVLTALCVGWATVTTTRLLVAARCAGSQALLLAYPAALLFVAFALNVVF